MFRVNPEDFKPSTRLYAVNPHTLTITDGRHGGRCRSRWDQRANFWTTIDFKEALQDLDVLCPMLDSYPKIPQGFVGWWRF